MATEVTVLYSCYVLNVLNTCRHSPNWIILNVL
ncbi:hypothetical protein OIU79_004241 [Salix purpurea]|uniref:Uncharacterized protein n=1 Tax=Salix purpurea TaxID=77065 RepID=A0A9Q0Z9C7_SALPP|nr:hypothetical protein OIU79_004241 [Salix purpurea]